MSLEIRPLSLDDATLEGLADILVDVVEAGFSVGFMSPYSRAEARAFWTKCLEHAAEGGRVVLGAYEAGRLIGTASLVTDMPPNQPHRADVCKVLTLARGRGVGEALMHAIEAEAQARGRWLLVLDAVSNDLGAKLYRKMGWTEAGEIPDYALMPDGAPCPTTYFYKRMPWAP